MGLELRVGETSKLAQTGEGQRIAGEKVLQGEGGVNPATAERDMRLPQLLDEAFGANLCGVYLDVIEGGRIAPGGDSGVAFTTTGSAPVRLTVS